MPINPSLSYSSAILQNHDRMRLLILVQQAIIVFQEIIAPTRALRRTGE